MQDLDYDGFGEHNPWGDQSSVLALKSRYECLISQYEEIPIEGFSAHING